MLRQWTSRGMASYPGPGPTGCAARDNCFTSPRRYPLPCKLRTRRLCHRVIGKGLYGIRHVKNMVHTGHSRSSKSVPLLLKTQAQRGEVTCQRSHSKLWQRVGRFWLGVLLTLPDSQEEANLWPGRGSLQGSC